MKNLIKTIKTKLENWRDGYLIEEDKLLSVKDDIERSIDYFNQCLENGIRNITVPDSDRLVIEKIADLEKDLAIINAELDRVNRVMKGLLYRTINRFCYDATPYMYM